jgi:hypothetical protein
VGSIVTRSVCAVIIVCTACGGDDQLEKDLAAASDLAASGPAASVSDVDPCSLVTESEAEQVVGRDLVAPARQGRSCQYLSSSGAPEVIIAFVPATLRNRSEFDRFMRDQVDEVNERLAAQGVGEMTLDVVNGLPEPAYHALALYVYRGGKVLSIAAGDKDREVAIAALALPRWN